VYADFEATLKPLEPDDPLANTTRIQQHDACSYGYKIVSRVEGVDFPDMRHFTGPDAASHFLETLSRDLYTNIMPLIENDVDMVFDDDAQLIHFTSTECYICKKALGTAEPTVRDHCHFTGRYRGAAHQSCNLQYQINKKAYQLPVIFHNLRGYDAHHIILALTGGYGNVKVIPNNMEKYISFSIGRLRFIDSMQFLSASLETLAETVTDFKNLNGEYPNPMHQELLRKKQVFPYDHLDSLDRMDERSLPTREQFYSKLYGEEVDDDKYERAQQIWRVFDCQTLYDYALIYLKTDVLLLADIFEQFRSMGQKYYGLDPAHYLSLPAYSWDAALKLTSVNIELIKDPDMYLMFESAIRGGVSMVSQRYAEDNHPERPATYNESEPTSTLMYMDANALYAHAMVQPLPLSGFKMLSEQEVKEFDLSKLCQNDDIGYLLEVDLDYPVSLHNDHNCYPLAPEHMVITPDMMSEFQQANDTPCPNIVKLVPNLRDKKKYRVHSKNLELYIELGMVCTKIHRIVQFNQSPWVKEYILFNTLRRQEAALASDTFLVNFFKLISNAFFGKVNFSHVTPTPHHQFIHPSCIH
jgi:hypothetical protein